MDFKEEKMKVILLDNIKGVGKKDEILNAQDGYARNYLLPRKLAVEANAENMSKLNGKKSSENHKKELEQKEAKRIKKELENITLKIEVKAGENGKIFGGVTAKEISENLKSQYKLDIDKKKINLKETIKVLGNFDIDIRLYEGIIGKLKLAVI